jgi:hypothetical protein
MRAWFGSLLIAVVVAVTVDESPAAKAAPKDTWLSYYDQAEPEAPDDWLIRVKRDFNNDGREDQAVTFKAACGVVCPFELWLQEKSGRYRLVGYVDMREEGYGLAPLKTGTSELHLCSSAGAEYFGIVAFVISSAGIVEDRPRSKALSSTATSCDAIKPLSRYPCERCSLAAPPDAPDKPRKPSECRRWVACE